MYTASHLCLALLLALESPIVAAKGLRQDVYALHRRHEPLGDYLRRDAVNILNGREALPQMATSTQTASSSTATAPTNLTQLNATSTQTCTTALESISNVTNPAGMAACYNVLFLNNQTGVFEVDLQLYQISQPSGNFAGIATTDIRVALGYPNAAISSAASTKFRREEQAKRQSNGNTEQLQQYTFVGQINKGLSLTQLKATDLMALVIPSIALYASSPSTHFTVSTNLTSASTVYFTTGVFAGQEASGAAAAAPAAAAAAASKAAMFTIPGKTLGIFPTGLIVTGSWAVLFIGTITLGTIGRIVCSKRKAQHRVERREKGERKPKRERGIKHGKPEVVVETVEIDIQHDTTFGSRPNYYIQHLARTQSQRGPARIESQRGPTRTDSLRGPARTDSLRGPARTDSLRGPARTDSLRGPARTPSQRDPLRSHSQRRDPLRSHSQRPDPGRSHSQRGPTMQF